MKTPAQSSKENLVKIGEASKVLGVSIDTLRRWEKKGWLQVIKTPGGTRLYDLNALKKLNPSSRRGPKSSVSPLFAQSQDNSSEQPLDRPKISLETDKPVLHTSTDSVNFHTDEPVETLSSQIRPTFFRKINLQTFVYTVIAVFIFTGLITSSLIASYLLNPNQTRSFVKAANSHPAFASMLSPFDGLALNTLGVINNKLVKELALDKELPQAPPGQNKIEHLSENLTTGTSRISPFKEGEVLAVSSPSASFLEINLGTVINGALIGQEASFSGQLTAPNILYSLTAGQNISITGDAQRPTISSTVALTDATTATKGIASFSNSFFAVTAGAVSLKEGGVTSAEIKDGTVSNSDLANNKITINTSGDLTGGGEVSLGGSIDLSVTSSASGVTSITGTANQVIASASTGAITLSLPQDIATSSSPTLAGLTLSSLNTAGGIVYTNGSGTLSTSAQGTSGYCLTSGGAGAPTWTACGAGSGTVGGSGTQNTLSKWSAGGSDLQDSQITDNGTTVTIGGTVNISGLTASRAVFTDSSKNLVSTGSSANLAATITDETGSGALVFATSPTLVTPVLGVATATSINGLTISSSTGVLTVTNGKTLSVADSTTLNTNSITFAGTEVLTLAAAKDVTFADAFSTSGANPLVLTTSGSTNVTLPTSGTLYGTLANSITSAQLASSLTNETGSGLAVFATSPTLVTPVLGVASATSINKVSITTPATSATLTLADGSSLITTGNSLTLTTTGDTNVTFPTSGTLCSTSTCLTSSTGVTTATGTASQILVNGDTSAHSGAITLTLPSAITAPGSFTTTTTLSSGTTVTAGTGLTVTTGNAAITAGALTLGGTTRISNAGVGTFITGTVIGSQTFTTNNIVDSGALTISTTTSSALTLDSGTTGNVNLGTGNNAKTVNIATGTAGNAVNIGTDDTTADAIGIGSAKDTTTIGGTVNLSSATASRFVLTDASKNLVYTGASSVLLNTLSDETGTGVAVFGTSPNFTTSVTTGSASFDVFNTNATTINAFGAATTLNIGPTGSGASSVVLSGGSADTGCTLAGATGNFTCSGNITGSSSGTVGFWSRSGTTLSPATSNDIVSVSGNSGDILTLASSATGASNKALNVSQTGATSGTDYGGYFSNTGAATTNVGLYATATGGTNNYAAIFEAGNVGIGTTAPTSSLHVLTADSSNNTSTDILTLSHDISGTSDGGSVLLLHANGTNASTTFTDSSSSVHTVTANGNAQLNTSTKKFGTASGAFDGTGDYLSSADSADWDFGSGAFTIETWIDLNNAPAAGFGMAVFSQDGGAATFAPVSITISTARHIVVFASASGSSWDVLNGQDFGDASSLLTTGSFHHFALTRSGNTWRVFIDGTQLGSNVTAAGTLMNSAATVYIGGQYQSTSGSGGLDGYLDEFRVLKGTAAYTSNFTPNTAAFVSPASSGIASGILFQNENAAGTMTSTGRIASVMTTTTDTSEVSDLTFSTVNNSGASVDPSERLRITGAGNVGIGDTSPDALLEVLGTTEQLRLSNADGAKDARFTVDSSGNLAINVSADGTGSQTLTLTGFTTLTSALTTVTLGTSGTINAGATALNLQADGAVDVNIAGGSGSTGCTVANSSGDLTCTGNITGASTGTSGYWTRSGTTLSPATSGDSVTTSGNISTSGSGTITSAGLLTGSAGSTISGGTINLNASSNNATNINTGSSSGAISLGNSGAGAIALSTGSTFGVTTTTSAQTYTSAVVTGTTTSSAFVFNASSLTSGTALRLTSTATSGKLVDLNATNTSGTIFNLAYGASKTLAGDLTGVLVDLNSGNVDATNQGLTGANFKIPTVTDTHTSGTKTLTGVLVNFGSGAGINQNGAGGTLEYVAGDFYMPALTQTAGTLNAYGTRVTTPATITTGGTAYGNYISAAGVGAGTLSGVGISSITAGAGTEYALNVGTGWDAVLRVGSTTVINGSGVTQVPGGGTGAATFTANGILYGNTTSALGVTAAGTTGQVLIGNTGSAPSWGSISGSTCTDCVVTDPAADQTIAPTGQGTTGLTVRQTSTASPTDDIFQITDSAGSTKYFYVDKDGNVSTAGTSSQTLTLTPTSNTTALTLVGTNVTSAALQYINAKNSSATSGIVNLAYGAAQTLSGTVIGIRQDLSTNVTATNQSVTGESITLPAATNTSGTQTYKGLVVSGGALNENGGTSTTFIGADITIPALTQTSGTLNAYGVQVTTPSSITTAGTASGIDISASGVGAGTLTGINIGAITAGAGTENGLTIGSGWDNNLYFNDTTTNVQLANGGAIVVKDTGGNTLCTITDSGTTGDLSCTGNITGSSSGTSGFWARSGTTLSPATANDIVSIANSTTSGADLAITNTGVYTGTGIFNLTANSATTGKVAAISATGLSTGNALSITAINGQGSGSTAANSILLTASDASSGTFSGTSRGVLLSFSNTSAVAHTQEAMTISNAAVNSFTDTATESLLLLDQADTTAAGTTAVTNALNITNSGGSTLTNAITVGSGTQAITTGLNLASTGLTTDISLQNGETIDNDVDGSVRIGATTLTLNGTTTITASSLATLTASAALAINGPANITTDQTTLAVFNTTATTLSLGGAATTALNLGNGTSSYTAINIGAGAAAANGINIGGTGANVIALGNTQTAGSISLGAAMTTGTISIGGTGLQTGTINLGTGTGAQAINLGTGGTGAKTVAVGSTASSSSLTLDSGTGAIGIGTSVAKTITIGNATGATALALNSGTGSQTFTSQVVSGTTTTSAFVFNGAALTSGTGIYATSATLTTGKLAQLSTGSSNVFSSGTLMDMRSTSTGLTGAAGTGSLENLDWSPGSATTATGDLWALNIGTNGTTTGNLFNLLDAGSSIFSVSERDFTTSLPTNFTAAGDVAVAYDLNFTNPTSSFIKSSAPLTVQAGESFNSTNLTLKTYNQGTIVLDTADTTGTAVDLTNTALTTGTLLNIASSNSSQTTGTALAVTQSGVTTGYTGNFVNITGTSTTGASNLVLLTAANTTNGNALKISNAATGLTAGSLLYVTSATTGAVATNGIVSLNATGNYTSSSGVGLLNVAANSTQAGTIAQISGTALTTGVALKLTGPTSGSTLTTGSLLQTTTASTGAINTNGIISFQDTGAFTSTSNNGFVNILANSTATGTITNISGTSVTTGIALNIGGPTSTGVTSGATSGFVNIVSDVGSGGTEGSLVYLAPDFSAGSATTGSGIKIAGSDTTAIGNTSYGINSTLTLTGNAAKTAYGNYSNITSTSTTADTLYNYKATQTASGAISANSRNQYGFLTDISNTSASSGGTTNLAGLYSTPTFNAGGNTTGATVNVYGGYISTAATLNTGGTITQYGLYVDDGSSSTTGTSKEYGVYIAPQTGADTGVGLCFDCDGTWSVSSVASGIQFGTDANLVTLYRSASDELKTDDALVVASNFTLGGTSVTYTQDVNYTLSGGVNGLSFDGTTFSVDATNNRIGIGTASPTVALEVTGGALLSSTIQFDGFVSHKGIGGAYQGNNINFEWSSPNLHAWVDTTDLGTITITSDQRNKTNITDITHTNGLEAIRALRPVTFNWNTPESAGDGTQYGFLAQQVREVLPDLVHNTGMITPNTPDGLLRLDYNGLFAPIVEAIQELDTKVTNISTANNLFDLDSQGNAVLKNTVSKLTIGTDVDVNGMVRANKVGVDASSLNLNGSLASVSVDAQNKVSLADAVNAINQAQQNQEGRVLGLEQREASSAASLAQTSQLAQQAVAQTVSLNDKVASTSANLSNLASQIDGLLASLGGGNPQASDSGIPDVTPASTLFATGSATLADLTVTSEATMSGQLTAYKETVQDTFKSLGETFLGNTTVAGDLSQDGTLSITEGSKINAFPTLYFQTSFLAQAVDFFNGLVTIDKTGRLAAKEVVADQFKVNAQKSAGKGVLHAGQTQVTINNVFTKADSIIILTPENLSSQPLAVTTKIDGTSFTVKVSSPELSDVNFSYLIIGQEVGSN